MAAIQLLFWLGFLMVGLGIGIGAVYWFHVRKSGEKPAPQWKPPEQAHRRGA